MASVSSLRTKISSIFAQSLKAVEHASRTPDSTITYTAKRNNVFAVVSSLDGEVVASSSGGRVGFKHRARGSPEAAQAAAEAVAKRAVEKGFSLSHLRVAGPSRGRSSLLRGLASGGMHIVDIRDVTPTPMPGTRPKKSRRL